MCARGIRDLLFHFRRGALACPAVFCFFLVLGYVFVFFAVFKNLDYDVRNVCAMYYNDRSM